MHYASNQFDKLICFKNIVECEPKRKERCVYLKVSYSTNIKLCLNSLIILLLYLRWLSIEPTCYLQVNLGRQSLKLITSTLEYLFGNLERLEL